MPLLLSDIKPLSQDKLTQDVIDEFRKSPILDLLPFDNTVKLQGGTTLAYSYNRVTTPATAAGRAFNTEYTSQEAKTTAYTVNLRPFGGSFDIDRAFIKGENGQVVDNVQFQLQKKIEATRALFHDWFINGDSAADPTAFDGLSKAITGSDTELAGDVIDLSTADAVKANWFKLTFSLRKLFSKLMGQPSVLMMNSLMYGAFQTAADFATGFTTTSNDLGQTFLRWGQSVIVEIGDKPGSANPIIPVSSTDGSTSIYAARLDLDAVHGVSIDGSEMVDVFLPDMTAPKAVKTGEVEMIGAVAIKATKAAGVLRNIKVEA